MLLSWASAGRKNNVKVITSQNLFTGMLSGYVVAAYLSDGMGPMAGIVTGVLTSVSCYGIFSIKRKISNRLSVIK
jgi:ammonia channel protein AmtB